MVTPQFVYTTYLAALSAMTLIAIYRQLPGPERTEQRRSDRRAGDRRDGDRRRHERLRCFERRFDPRRVLERRTGDRRGMMPELVRAA